jgi:hypothetical protein
MVKDKNVEETREIEITEKRFTHNDILQIAKIIAGNRSSDDNSTFTITLNFADGTTYKSSSLDLLEKGGVIDLKPLSLVEFYYYYSDRTDKKNIMFSAVHGGAYIDRIKISGNDPSWVHDIFTALHERINAVAPSGNWFTKHRTLSEFLLIMGLGSLLVHIIGGLSWLAFLSTDLPKDAIENLKENFILQLLLSTYIKFFILWFFRFIFGICALYFIEEWFFSAWPKVELDIGPEHLKVEKIRRNRIKFFIYVVILPLFVTFIYDMIKQIL